MTDQPPLNYQRVGSGPPLVFVHGYLGGSDMWAEQIEYFKQSFDVIAVDLPGFGKSHELQAHDSIFDISAHVLSFLRDIGVEEFYLLGHSMGGMIVQQMTLDAPDRIQRLICYGTGPVGVLPGRFEPIETSRQRIISEGLAPTARRIAATWFVDGDAAKGFPICREIGEMASLDAALNSLTAWEGWNVKDRLGEIQCPTLIIWGELDQSYDITQPNALHDGIRHSQFLKVLSCAHNVHMEATAKFNQMVEAFLMPNDSLR